MRRRNLWIVGCLAMLMGLSMGILRWMESMRHRAEQVRQIEKDLQRGRLLHAQGRPLEAALFFQRAIEHGANDSALPYLLSRTVHSLDATRLILPEQAARVAMVRFSPDGARILTSADDGAVTLWNAQTGERLLAYPTGGKTPYSISMNDVGTKVLVASGKDEVSLFDAATAKRLPLGIVPKYREKLFVDLFADLKKRGRFASFLGGSDELAYLEGDGTYGSACGCTEEPVPSGKLIIDSRAIISDVSPFDYPVAFDPSGRHVFAHVAGDQFGVFDTRSAKRLYTFDSSVGAVERASFSPDGERLLVVTAAGAVVVYDSLSGQRMKSVQLSKSWQAVSSAAFSPDGHRIAAAVHDSIEVIDANSGAPINTFLGHTGAVTDVSWSPDGESIASASADRTVRVWDLRAGDFLFHATPRWGTSVRIASDPDTKQELLRVDATGELFCTNSRTGRDVESCRHTTWQEHRNEKAHLVASLLDDRHDHSRYVELRSSDRTAFGLLADEPRAIVIRHRDGDVTSLALHPDGTSIVTGGSSGVLRLWDTQTGSPGVFPGGEPFEIRAHSGSVRSVRFHPSGQEITSAGNDQTVSIWDARTGALKRTLRGHHAEVQKVVYTPDGTLLISFSSDGITRRWLSQTGELVDETSMADVVSDVALNEQGDMIATLTRSSGVQVRLLQTDALEPLARAALLRCRLGLKLQGDSAVSAPIDQQTCRGFRPLFPRNPVPWTERHSTLDAARAALYSGRTKAAVIPLQRTRVIWDVYNEHERDAELELALAAVSTSSKSPVPDAVSARLARLPGSQDPEFWIQLAGFSYHWLDRPLWAQWAVRQAQSQAHDGKPFTESAWPLLAMFEAGDVSRLRSEGPTLLATLKNPTSIIGGLIMWITEAQAHPGSAQRFATLIVSEYAKLVERKWHPQIAGLTLLRRKAHNLAEPGLRSRSLAVLSLLEQRLSASTLNALAAQLQVPAPSISSMPQHDRF